MHVGLRVVGLREGEGGLDAPAGDLGTGLCASHAPGCSGAFQVRPLVAFAPSLSRGWGAVRTPERSPLDHPRLPQLSPESQYRMVRLSLAWWSPSPPPKPSSPRPSQCLASEELRQAAPGSCFSLSPYRTGCSIIPVTAPLYPVTCGPPGSLQRRQTLFPPIRPFPVAKRLTGEPPPLLVGPCPHQLQVTGVTASPTGFSHPS